MNLDDMKQLAINKSNAPSTGNFPVLGRLSNGKKSIYSSKHGLQGADRDLVEDAKERINQPDTDYTREVWDE